MRACLSAMFPVLFLCTAASASAEVSGTVVDQEARPIPRVLVTVADGGGTELARAFTGIDGAFRFDLTPTSGCLIEARLTGFRPARTGCASITPIRVVLAIAPREEVLVVSATRGDAPVGQIASAVTVFTGDALDRRQRPMLAELLRGSAGTAIVSAAPGNVASLFVRGGESNHTKVLLDGIPLNEPGGTFDFSNTATSHLGRVELVRGAHSALFGSDAVAGVLQLFTKRARPGEPVIDAAFDGGSFGTFRESLTFGGASSSWDYSLHASRTDTDNEGANHAFANTTLSASAGSTLAPGTLLRFVARAQISRTGVPGQTAFARADLDAFFKRRDSVAGIAFDRVTGNLRQTASYSFSHSNQIARNRADDLPYTPRFRGRVGAFPYIDFAYDSDNSLGRHHASYQLDWRPALWRRSGIDHLLTVAAEWDGERATLEDRVALTVTGAARDNVGWTLQHQVLWPRVFVAGGIRLEHNDSFGSAVVPRGSAAIVAREADGRVGTTRVKVAAGAGIKEPTILQSFSPSPFFPGNPSLDPERSRTFDVGLEQSLFGNAVTLEMTWFANRFHDLISTKFTGTRYEFFNIGDTRARGLELAGHVSRHLPFRLRAGYTLLASEIVESAAETDPVFGKGQWLFRRPRHSGFVEAGGAWHAVDASVIGTFVGRAVDSDFSDLQPAMTFNPGHERWDVRAEYAVSRRLTATLAIDNLFDADYMEPLGYPVLGRAVRAGVRVTY